MSKATWPMAAAGSAAVAAALALPGGAAYATTSPPPTSQGNTSVASDNQALISLNIPADICGIAVAVLGSAQSGCQGGAVAQSAPVASAGTAPGTNTGNTAVGSGNKVSVPVSVPVDVCGVSIAVLGPAKSGCQGGATVGGKLPPPPSGPTLPGPKPKPKPKPKHHKPPKHHGHHGHGHGHHGCTENCTTGGGSTSGGGSRNGGGSTGSGSTTLTSSGQGTTSNQTGQTASALGSLPTTGMNLAGILAGALGLLGAGTGVVFATRRRSARYEG